jgi:hypothetical protein
MHGDMKSLLKALRRQTGEDGSDEDYEFGDSRKVCGNLEIDSRVEIHWKKNEGYRPDPHEGQVFTLPGLESDDALVGGVILVPHPYFEGDMDGADPLWMTVDEALKNPQIEKIVVMSHK